MKERKKRRSFVDWFLQKPESGVMLILIVFYIVVTCVNPRFLSTKNVLIVLHASGFTLLSVTGMSLILIIGGLDLSIGSVYALAAVTSSLLMTQTGLPVWICIIVGLQLGALIGTLNGLLIVYIKIPPMIATLGTQYIARGAVTVLTHGTPIYPLPDSFVRIEEIRIFGFVPVVVPIAIVVAIVFHFILSKTVFGRSVYAIGGNGEAARISGISINKTKMSTYIIMGVLAATAGILTASRLGSAEPSTGTALEMKVICGAVIGGVSVAGGMGTILGAALGALFMESLTNALTVMRISVYWQNVVFGTVLVLSVMMDEYKRQMIKKHAMKEMKDEKASAVKE